MRKKTQYIWQRPEWPEFTWNGTGLLAPLGECRLLQEKLLAKVSILQASLGRQAQVEVLVEEALKTSALEGERLDEHAVRSSLASALGLPVDRPASDAGSDDLLSVLLDRTRNFAVPLTPQRLWRWQAALFPAGYAGVHRIKVGGWREGSEPMRVVSVSIGGRKVHYVAPPSEILDTEMARLIGWWQASGGKVEGIIRAAIAHFWFVTIHPFDDGNGRIARLLTDMALAQDDEHSHGYFSLSTQIMCDQDSYYKVLEQTQKGGGDIADWLIWFLGCYQRAIRHAETLLASLEAG